MMQPHSDLRLHVWDTCLLVCAIVGLIFTTAAIIPIAFIMFEKDRVIFNIISLIYIAWVIASIIVSLTASHGTCSGYSTIFYLSACKYGEVPIGVVWGIGGLFWNANVQCYGELCGLVVLPWLLGQVAAIIGAIFAIFAHNEAIRKIIALKGDLLYQLCPPTTLG